MDDAAYLAFLKKRDRDFRSISDQTEGAMEAEDLHSEAWFVAEYHAAKRGFEIDWADPADQKLIFGTLTVKYVWKTAKERALKVSADEEREGGDDCSAPILTMIMDEAAADPLEILELQEEEDQKQALREKEDDILESYSQSVAYNIALWHFDNTRLRLAAHLAIDRSTLSDRIARAAAALKIQSSLFDRLEKIDETFMPKRGYAKPCWLSVKLQIDNAQWGWEFDEDIPPVQNALSKLRHDELCEVVINGKTREASWHRTTRLFFFTDGNQPLFCSANEIQEWWPASVKF
jgi:hypothetical protein